MRVSFSVLVLLLAAPWLACAAAQSEESAAIAASQPAASVRIGLMPAVNSIPLIVAQEEGLFAEEGVEVELVMFRSQFYREAALQAEEVDGSVSDLVNVINAWNNGANVKAVIHTRGLFGLLAAPGAAVRTVDQWKDPGVERVRVGLLQDSIIFYAAERALEHYGADPGKIEPISTLHLPSRLEMLLADNLEAAVLPEPMTRVALGQGAHLIADTTVLQETPGVLLFTARAREEKAAGIRAVVRAYDRAARAVNEDPDRYRSVIVEEGGFPPVVRDSMVIPEYGPVAPPSRRMVTDVSAWMVEKGLIGSTPDYAQVVDTRFVD